MLSKIKYKWSSGEMSREDGFARQVADCPNEVFQQAAEADELAMLWFSLVRITLTEYCSSDCYKTEQHSPLCKAARGVPV